MIKSKRRCKPLLANLVALWHPTLNGDLRPEDVHNGDKRTVWFLHYDRKWRQWHEWDSTPKGMNITGNCPICTGRRLVVGINDLATRNPKVASMWHPTLNSDLTPQMFTEHAPKKVWWRHYHRKTRKWHEWPARIGKLTRKNPNKCAICSGKQIQIGVNDLASQNIRVAKMWHPTLNGKLTAKMVTEHSFKMVWWRHYHRKTKKWHE